jgi:hypothetical protein
VAYAEITAPLKAVDTTKKVLDMSARNLVAPETILRNIECKEDCDCWFWVGFTNDKGYGRLRVYPYEKILAHRLSYIVYKGPIAKGLEILHTCDTPRCVNPEHLKLGTHDENVADMLTKGRQFSKLNKEQALEIYKSPLHPKELARIYDINIRAVYSIKSKETWFHMH